MTALAGASSPAPHDAWNRKSCASVDAPCLSPAASKPETAATPPATTTRYASGPAVVLVQTVSETAWASVDGTCALRPASCDETMMMFAQESLDRWRDRS